MSRIGEIVSVLAGGAGVGFATVLFFMRNQGYCDITQPSLHQVILLSVRFGGCGGFLAALAWAYFAGLFERLEEP
jgi:hypothetical protein